MRLLFISLFIIFSMNKSTPVTVTVYHAVPEQCNSDPGHTASMFELNLDDPYSHRIIAVSRDLLSEHPFGSYVVVEGTDYDGTYQVQDLLNKRYKKQIDILINLDMPVGKWANASITRIK